MKSFYVLLVPCLMMLFTACQSSKIVQSPNQNENEISDGYTEVEAGNSANNSQELNPNEDHTTSEDLVVLLTKVPGLSVAGHGHGASFKVRGQASFYASSDPLFVVNGNSVGTNFSNIYDTIDPKDVKSIRLLKGTDAAIYGSRGANGVIVIRTGKLSKS